jgi:hypothetical protein
MRKIGAAVLLLVSTMVLAAVPLGVEGGHGQEKNVSVRDSGGLG